MVFRTEFVCYFVISVRLVLQPVNNIHNASICIVLDYDPYTSVQYQYNTLQVMASDPARWVLWHQRPYWWLLAFAFRYLLVVGNT